MNQSADKSSMKFWMLRHNRSLVMVKFILVTQSIDHFKFGRWFTSVCNERLALIVQPRAYDSRTRQRFNRNMIYYYYLLLFPHDIIQAQCINTGSSKFWRGMRQQEIKIVTDAEVKTLSSGVETVILQSFHFIKHSGATSHLGSRHFLFLDTWITNN